MTEDYVKVATFTFPYNLYVIRTLLEAKGIDTCLKDYHIIQVCNFYSIAVGGIKLKVPESQKGLAISILIKEGFLLEKDFQPSVLWKKLKDVTAKIPLLNKFTFVSRYISVVTVFSILITISGIFPFFPEETNGKNEINLVNEDWCLQYIKFKRTKYVPKSIPDSHQVKLHDCPEMIHFKASGQLNMPGFTTPRLQGKWRKVSKRALKISELDTLGYFLEGKYHIEKKPWGFKLSSDKTNIYCTRIEKEIFNR